MELTSLVLMSICNLATSSSFSCIAVDSWSFCSLAFCSSSSMKKVASCRLWKGQFHDQGDAKWIVIREQLRGNNNTPFWRPTPGHGWPPSGRIWWFQLLLISNSFFFFNSQRRGMGVRHGVFKAVEDDRRPSTLWVATPYRVS
jgi:hypothetical protein